MSFNKTTREEHEPTYRADIEYRSFSFNVGYDLTKSQWFSVYPYLGFKGSGLNYLYRERLTEEISMDDYLQTNLRYKEINNSRGHLDLGIGLSHQWFYLVNFRAGYLLPIEKISWSMNDSKTNLTGAPPISYPFYFSLTVGIGGIMSDQDFRRRYPQP
jgi:hypothetical protein